MTLVDLLQRLGDFASGASTMADLRAAIDRVLLADPLGAERSDSGPWDAAPDDSRLFWRLAYLFESADAEADAEDARAFAERIVQCMASTGGSAATTLELLPLLADQPRLCQIVERHARGVITRTGFLSVVAESGYVPHVKLWLAHAPNEALVRLCERLVRGEYAETALTLERAPGQE